MAQVVRASLDRQRRLVADASHQLRNPLAAVRLRADSLDDYVAEAGRPTYGSMTAELDRLENLLQQLLRLARAEEVSGSRKVGLSTAASESTDLDDVIAERLAFWQPVADRQISDCATDPTIPGWRCSSPATTWSNCSTSPWTTRCGMPARKPRSRCQPGVGRTRVELIVSDDGTGLPDDDLSRAAARFWRGRDDSIGTGLGLAIAAEIAAGHGGTIAVERAPEGGLLVRYRLPLAGEPT